MFLKIRLYNFINDLIDKDIFTPFLEQMINNIKESYEKMINEKKFFYNIENKIKQAKENINKLFTLVSGNLDDNKKTLLDNYINNIIDDLNKFYYENEGQVYKLFDEEKTLQESMKNNIIESYNKKNLNITEISMDKYIENITDHLITPIASNKENFCFYFIFSLFREDIINCICEEKAEELRQKKIQLDKSSNEYQEYIDKLGINKG